MARASTDTLLCLDDWARIIGGINPILFNQATADPLAPCYCSIRCESMWMQYDWQCLGNNAYSRETLARHIADAEREIEQFLCVPLCPRMVNVSRAWHCGKQEIHVGSHKPLPWPVARATLELGTVDKGTAAYELTGAMHDNGQGVLFWPQLATLTLEVACSVQACEIELYAASPDMNGNYDPTMRICPLKSVSVQENGGTCELVITVPAWQLIKPELWEEFPICPENSQCPAGAIDLLDLDNYIETLSIARVQYGNSEAIPPARIGKVGNGGHCDCDAVDSCEACEVTWTNACWVQYPNRPSVLKIVPAEWNADTSEWCATAENCCSCDPADVVEVCFWEGFPVVDECGDMDQCEAECPPEQVAIAIAELAAARMPPRTCGCSCSGKDSMLHYLQANAASLAQDGPGLNLPFEEFQNPFGSKYGELQAYRRLKLLKLDLMKKCPQIYVSGYAPAAN